MRALVLISSLFLSCALSNPVWAQVSEDDGVSFVISEFEKLKGLELRDCIAGYDTALYQAKNDPNSSLSISYTEGVIAYMRQALDRKDGRSVPIKEIRLNSSFHVSGVYLGGGGEVHLAYQAAIIGHCNAQIGRIAKQAAERKGQL